MQKDSHRVLSLLLALILSVSLSACGGNGHKESSTVSESSKPQSEASSEASRIVSQPESDTESSQTVTHPESDTSGTQTVIEVTMEDLPELMPDILKLREKKYDEMPLLETQEQLSEYALWNFVSGSLEFECRIPWELSYGLSAEALDQACSDAMCYYLFSSYRPWDMLTEDDGDPDSVYAKVKIVYDVPEYDQEARLKAYSYVVNNPPPEGGFTDYEEEKEYARKVHDYIARRIAYDPIGYEPELPLTQTRYDIYQEAYNVLGEGQETAVCAGYARAFGLICQYAGINCAWVWGNETEESSHAWNVLFPCDGSEPVLVDVTWDDGQSPDLPEQTYVDDTYFYIPLSAEYEHEADEEMWAFIQYLNEGARSR
ncbi:MAG: transglutaminase domain-containing protein [Oscillospiraceae bacterium]|nr:transglutaminase domain-containing protein [Oscillospiraceae bacterium]